MPEIEAPPTTVVYEMTDVYKTFLEACWGAMEGEAEEEAMTSGEYKRELQGISDLLAKNPEGIKSLFQDGYIDWLLPKGNDARRILYADRIQHMPAVEKLIIKSGQRDIVTIDGDELPPYVMRLARPVGTTPIPFSECC